MSGLFDESRPGPAGLFFRPKRLTQVGWQQERKARAALERWCHQCGQTANFAYGETLKTEGVWACADADCRAAAQTEAEAGSKDLAQATREVSNDLFGEAA